MVALFVDAFSAAGEDARLYREWVRGEAKKIGSDGCTCVAEFHPDCCFEHDLGYYYGRDPRSAFQVGWPLADPVDRSFVDHRFRDCNPEILFYRWWGVRMGGWNSWRKHRKARP